MGLSALPGMGGGVEAREGGGGEEELVWEGDTEQFAGAADMGDGLEAAEEACADLERSDLVAACEEGFVGGGPFEPSGKAVIGLPGGGWGGRRAGEEGGDGPEGVLEAWDVGEPEGLAAPHGAAVLLDDLDEVGAGVHAYLPCLGALHPADEDVPDGLVGADLELGEDAPALVWGFAVEVEVDVEAVTLDGADHAFGGGVGGVGGALVDGGDPTELSDFAAA